MDNFKSDEVLKDEGISHVRVLKLPKLCISILILLKERLQSSFQRPTQYLSMTLKTRIFTKSGPTTFHLNLNKPT